MPDGWWTRALSEYIDWSLASLASSPEELKAASLRSAIELLDELLPPKPGSSRVKQEKPRGADTVEGPIFWVAAVAPVLKAEVNADTLVAVLPMALLFCKWVQPVEYPE